MRLSTVLFKSILAFNLIFKGYSLPHDHSGPSAKIVGSDDEELQPLLYEKGESTEFISQTVTRQSRTSRKSRKSRKSRLSRPDNEFNEFDQHALLLKMNLNFTASQNIIQDERTHPSFTKLSLDLPSIKSNVARSSLRAAGSPEVAEMKPEVIIASIDSQKTDERVLHKFPHSKINSEEIEVVIFQSHGTKVVPGTVIASKNKVPAPGTIITTIKNDKTVPTSFPITLIDSSNLFSEDFNISILCPKLPTVDFSTSTVSKHKKIKSLDEKSINTLDFDNSVTGPKINLDTEITSNFVSSVLVPFFKSGKVLDRKSTYVVIIHNGLIHYFSNYVILFLFA